MMTIVVISIAITLPIIFWVGLGNLQSLIKNWDNGAQISLFLKQDVPLARAETLTQELKNQPAVVSVNYISPSQGLADFEKQIGLTNILSALPANPLRVLSCCI